MPPAEGHSRETPRVNADLTDVQISYVVTPLPVAPAPKAPASKPAEKTAEKPQANCQPSGRQYPYRRGFLRGR